MNKRLLVILMCSTLVFLLILSSIVTFFPAKVFAAQSTSNYDFTDINNYKEVDLRPNMQPVYNQSKGSCSAEAVIGSIEYQMKNKLKVDFKPSRAFTYYMTRTMNGTENEDAGASHTITMFSTMEYGLLERDKFPESNRYDKQPSFDNLMDSLQTKTTSNKGIYKFEDIVMYLQNDIPVVFGTNIDEWGSIGKDGVVRASLKWNKEIDANKNSHSMVIVGYLPNFTIDGVNIPVFVIRNSWGTRYGDNGYSYIPIEKLLLYNSDSLGVVRVEESNLGPAQFNRAHSEYLYSLLIIK